MDTLTCTRSGATWRFSDGTTLPVVSGGSDAGDLTPEAEPAAVEAPVTADPPPADPEAAPPADPFDDPAHATFDRAYVERLRHEAAERRTTAKPYTEAFEGYDDGDRDTLLDLARTLQTDPRTAAEWMRSQAEAILGADAGPAAPEAADEDSAPFTRAELEQFLSAREAKAASAADQASQVAAITTEAKALGFDPDTDRRGYLALLDAANNDTAGDLTKAAALIKGERQKIVDDYLAAKSSDSDAAVAGVPQAGAGKERAKKSDDPWADNSRAVRAQINARGPS